MKLALSIMVLGALSLALLAASDGRANAGSCSGEYAKCQQQCAANPSWSKCPATCQSAKNTCLQTGTFNWKRKAPVHNLTKK